MVPKSTLGALALLGALSLTACAPAPNNASASAVVDPAAFETVEPSAVSAPGDDGTGIKAAVGVSQDPSIHPTATQPTETPAPAGAGSYTPDAQEQTAYTAALMDGTWVQQDSTNLENYMDAVIHDGIIEVTYHLNHEELATPFWAGTFEAKTGNFSYISHVDHAQLSHAPYASDKETKEFVMEDGVLSFPMTFEGATRIIHLEKQHS